MTTSPSSPDLRPLRGLVATINLTGSVTSETSDCLLKMGLWNAAHGFTNIEYMTFPAALVEAGRDSACQHALAQKYDFLLQFDGDATFPPDSLARLLTDAYITVPDADAIGAYAQLKGGVNIPTIDRGSGTWEVVYPGLGVIPVIRTGGHFLLIKTSALQKFGPPWFRTREAMRPVQAFAEIDNYARVKLDGSNPLAVSDTWQDLIQLARKESPQTSNVGEDSGFSDNLLAAGGKLYVDTDLVTGHVSKHVISPADLRKNLRARDERVRASVGINS